MRLRRARDRRSGARELQHVPQAERDRFLVAGGLFVAQGRVDELPLEDTGDLGEQHRSVTGGHQLVVWTQCSPRLEVRIARPVGAIASDVPERNAEAEQRMADARVAPVDEAIAAVVYAHV